MYHINGVVKGNMIMLYLIPFEYHRAYYGDIKRNTFFSQLVNLQQNGLIIEHIQQFHRIIC